MITKKLLFLSLPILFISLNAKTINFQEALNLTLQNNKELKAKKLDIKKAEENTKEATGYKLGKLEFAENISITDHAGYVFGMKMAVREATQLDFVPLTLNNPNDRHNFETKLTYEAPIFTGYKLENAKKMATLQVMATKAKYTHDEKQIGLEVLKAYNGAVAAKKFIKMTTKARIIASRFVKTSQDLYDNKLTRIIDVKQAKMAEFSINTKVKEAKTKFKLAIAYLQFLTNDYKITDVKKFSIMKIDTTNLIALQENAIDQRDDYKWMQHNTTTMKQKIAFDSANDYPTIGAHVEYGTNNDNFSTLSLKKDYYMAAVGLTYTLFDGEISTIQKQKAKIDYAKTKQYSDYMKDGINLEVKKNYLDFMTASSTLDDKVETQKMSEDILKETEDIYKNNLRFRTNMMYLLMSLENMLKAQADVITSHYNTTISSAKLKLSTGKSLKVKAN